MGPATEEVRARIVVLSLGPLLLSVAYLAAVLGLAELGRPLVVSPRAWPLAVAVGMLVLSVAITVTTLVRGRHMVEDGENDLLNWTDALVAVAGLLIVALAFERVGYVITSFVLVAGLSTWTSPTRWRRNLVAALAFVLIAFLLFDRALGVRLPPGILPMPT